ncbi:HEPN domain-containing protein [Burkholderia pseudomallei]
MFEDTLRALQRLAETQNTISFSSDQDGYFDRECPSPECMAPFKVFMADWKDKVRDEEVFCPFCRHTADAKQWWTQDQIAHINSVARATVGGAIHDALRSDSERWNRQQPRGGLISMRMQVESRSRDVPVPLEVAAPMQLKITCSSCGCRYAVIGAAYFCPSCGHNAADQMFQLTIAGIRQSLNALGTVRGTIADPDAAENTARLIIESSLQNAVSAFQRCAEALFSAIPGTGRIRRNAFQNLTEGSALWASAVSTSYDTHLSPTELDRLQIAFQQRHLLAHTQGVVDADYVSKTGDARYQPGQRVVVRVEVVRETLDLVEKLINGMRRDIPTGTGVTL